MTDEHVVLSERPEDQLKAVEWAREQKKKFLMTKAGVSRMHLWKK